ncbi:glycosyl transferase family 1 [Bradyrhizobium macuxiense]|uniref:Glycosyl transferase family 1 n=1 Tax=Bradyrhizobium macuxiense TaxID=1755647 RepID=A0A109K271_9BRAD|nr:glycosyltransferase family 4 protein [Bradyrhizobium macuxiense]KWV59457.1 glycosyl transferase family 1 [Bradyrhizobium macuxiense]
MKRANPKLIFLVTEDWYFWSHRLPMARAAREAGFEVGVATRVKLHGDRIRSEGFSLYPLSWTRGSLSVLQFFRAVGEVGSLYRREKPDIVHHIALKSVVIGGIAAKLWRVPHVVNALTGLGHLFASDEFKSRVLRFLVGPFLKLSLQRQGSVVLLQNSDDRALLTRLGYCDASASVIRGSGIDLRRYQPFPPVDRPVVTAAFVGRIVEIKGVRVLMRAHQRLRERGVRLKLLLAGVPDVENIGAISRDEVEKWAREPDVEWLGHVDDVRQVWSRADIAVLPSIGGEGLPKSLLEAAACGRAIVATDVPGSREIAIAGRNAIVVPPNDAVALSDALEQLTCSAELRSRFGVESRRLVESDMAEERVAADVVALYHSLIQSNEALVGAPA